MSRVAVFIMYKDICTEIKVVMEQIKYAEYQLKYWFGINLEEGSGIPLGGYGSYKFGANTSLTQAEQTITNYNRLHEQLGELEQSKVRLYNLLNQFETLEYKISFMRYTEGKSLKEIASELGYSYDYIREVMSRMKKKPTFTPHFS